MRFLLLAYPLLVLLLAAFGFVVDQVQPDPGGLWPATTPVRGQGVAAAWALEALALLSLFLLLEGRFRRRLWEGLATAWIAWVFRGPLLVVTVAAAGLPHRPWWRLSIAWWFLYTAAGLLLASLAARRSGPEEPDGGSSGAGPEPDDRAGGVEPAAAEPPAEPSAAPDPSPDDAADDREPLDRPGATDPRRGEPSAP